jgi:hypothetical protein
MHSAAASAGAAARAGVVGTVADLAGWESVDGPASEGRVSEDQVSEDPVSEDLVSEDPAEAIPAEAGRVVDGRAAATVIARASWH